MFLWLVTACVVGYLWCMPKRGQYDRSQSATLRRREQRAALLTAAAEVFAKVGYSRATVEAIVVRAEMSRRTFYEHFDDLRDVLRKLHERSAKFALAFVRGAIDSAADPVVGIEAGIEAFLTLSANNVGLARVLFKEVRASGDDRRREALEDEFGNMLLAALARAHARGQIARTPDKLTVMALVGAIETIAMRLVDSGELGELLSATPMLLHMTLSSFSEDARRTRKAG
jgi:AcrR family transcriptional regulator